MLPMGVWYRDFGGCVWRWSTPRGDPAVGRGRPSTGDGGVCLVLGARAGEGDVVRVLARVRACARARAVVVVLFNTVRYTAKRLV